jgi:hypothetical protein
MFGMVKYRPSKSFVLAMLCMGPLGVALYCGLLPELEAIENAPVPGEIRFRTARPPFAEATGDRPGGNRTQSGARWSMDWLTEAYEGVMSWDKNPWKTERLTFGSHYFKLLESKDPRDQARAKELRRLADLLYKRVLERFPELAVEDKNVPPERNGFLKWLEFAERFEEGATKGSKGIGLPEGLVEHVGGRGPWDAAAAKAWLAQEKALVDEIRAIGLMPEQSIEGIDVDRWAFMPARLAKSAAEVLLLDARLAAEEGNVAGALESVRAANGLTAHFGNVETPTLLAVTVQILVQLTVQNYVLAEVMPALPAGQMDPAAWQAAVNPVVVPPGEFGRIMKGEWNVMTRQYLLPMLCDQEDPKYPRDPEALIDFQAGYFANKVVSLEGLAVTEWPNLPASSAPDTSHLSR